MDVRPYETRDRSACLGVFDSLTPDLLDPSARPVFESWLDRAACAYFVMEHEESVVGCGGYTLSPVRSSATLCWGMVRRSAQKAGLGRFLLMYRIREIGRQGSVSVVLAHSPRPSAGFFEKQGFRVSGTADRTRVTGVEPIELTKKLTVCP
jgi:N-acetylglutamate synthase-like GNAT family acetyltransferase